MIFTPSRHITNTPEHRYEEMRAYVFSLTDKQGEPVDPGIFKAVVALNLLGVRTFQSCEGHLDHGCPYPWVTVIDEERSRQFNRRWVQVCELEEQAKSVRTIEPMIAISPLILLCD